MRSVRLMAVLSAVVLFAVAVPAHEGPGRAAVPFIADQTLDIGQVDVWNNGKQLDNAGVDIGSKMLVQIDLGYESPWRIVEVQAFVGSEDSEIPSKNGNPIPGKFPFKREFSLGVPKATVVVDLEDDLEFSWGQRSSRIMKIAVHADVVLLDNFGNIVQEEGAWAFGPHEFDGSQWGWWLTYEIAHPMRYHFIDAPVKGHGYVTSTHAGVAGNDDNGGFWGFPGEWVDIFIGPPTYDSTYSFYVGTAILGPKKLSPLDLYTGADSGDPRVVGVARTLQTLDTDGDNGVINIYPEVASCFNGFANTLGFDSQDFGDDAAVTEVLEATVANCQGAGGELLTLVSAADAQGNLEAGLNASGIFRKNVSKTEDWGESKQKLDVMPVYFPGVRSNGDPSFCDFNDNGVYDLGEEGVPYEEWRLTGCDPASDPDYCRCDPREVPDGSCVPTIVECREVAKPVVMTYMEQIDIHDDQVTTDFWDGRFAHDIVTAISRDDGTTWKRKNISRMAEESSYELESGEPFHGTCRSPVQKVNDNKILVVWTSTFCNSGNPRYAINLCDDPATDVVEEDDPATPDVFECAEYCTGNPDQGTQVCEPDYPFDDDYHVTDIWGVRGHQGSVDYDEVDDVADLGIGEIPFSCLWAARGVIVTQAELDAGIFDSLNVEDDPATLDIDETQYVELGDVVWFKPERLTSGRRDAYFNVVGSARGAGFAIAWQEDPKGLRPGKGKGPGQGWSGAITNHKTDIWYSFITMEDFALVDENFVPGGPPDGSGPDAGSLGLGRPKALVPFSLPVRVTDNDMVNTDTLKVTESTDCITPPDGTEQVCFPEIVDGTFDPLDPDTIANLFCDGPNPVANCCDHDNHDTDPNCEGLEGLHGNLTGTKRYAYMARDLDDDGDGVPDYQYYMDRGGTLDLCDISGTNQFTETLPDPTQPRWYTFVNTEGSSKLVCVSSDGRLIDGNVFAARPNIQLQPYTHNNGTPMDPLDDYKSAWVLLAYEETKGMGHAHAEDSDGGGQVPKPIKQDYGKDVLYHSFDFTKPDLVAPGHKVNLPAICGGLYTNYCEDVLRWEPGTWDPSYDAICTCTPGQPIPLYFEQETVVGTDPDGQPIMNYTLSTDFQQYRSEIARRVRFIAQSKGKIVKQKNDGSGTAGVIIFKQGQEGQGRPADVYVRRFVVPDTDTALDNPYRFDNLECNAYLDDSFGVAGYNVNVWGEPSGDRMCGGVFTDPTGGYPRRDHVNLTSADIDLAVDAGPDDVTPDDPTDDVYGTNKVLLWSYHDHNLGNESFGTLDGMSCDPLLGEVCPGMYSNAKSHRGFIRGDFLATAYALSPNWAAARNGRDRYNFYIRRSFDGGQTWTTTPSSYKGVVGTGVELCPEFRTDPDTHEAPIGTVTGYGIELAETCVSWCHPDDTECVLEGGFSIGPGDFEPARKISQFDNNKETSSDPRVGATPPVAPLDGRDGGLPILRFIDDHYLDRIFFVAWGGGDNLKSFGWTTITPEAPPTDIWYTRTQDFGDSYLKVQWDIDAANSNFFGETVWRSDFLAHGDEEEQGECQIRATSDGSKMYAIWHQLVPEEGDPDEEETRWYPWEPEVTHLNDLWFRRIIFWSDELGTP